MSPTRCSWPGEDALYLAYHDEEWGVPEYDDRALFEKLLLEGFQAGLSWITILRKRENFRAAFDGFNPERIARYTPRKVERLLQNAGIIRHRGKIEAAIGSARAYLDIMEKEGSFSDFIWDFVDGTPQQNGFKSMKDVPAETEMSRALSKELKRSGFKFCGPTIVYAFAQASGLVNDHMTACFRHDDCAQLATRK
ncbi:DNA-3-methyladenine glycosylase I [Tepidicaulis marinus]|uniref:DNA-3-methyladenine glycosylase I n=1 Tax=Tepidicaulis marinus TaxID=1333998 RepID=A0A081BFK1_9HYPH|nr:DNA-3-methyladenine glycosylase I [Tepidicaulis marinus]GAK46819.1 DNA-3-methyladenine glycosylase I [Tepidicaulis marinus]